MNEIARRALPFMTADEFLLWPGDGSGRRFHLFDGEVRGMAPASSTHGVIQGNLAVLLRLAARAFDRELQVVVEAAIVPAVTGQDNIRVPDLVVRRGRTVLGEIAVPEPLVVVEILSPGNSATTRENVRAYATLASVREIVVVSSEQTRVEVHRRGSDDAWQPRPDVTEAGASVVVSTVALSCPVEEIYEGTWLLDPPPSSSR